MKQFDCKSLMELQLEKTRQYVSKLHTKPRLLIIQLGDRPDSNKYVQNKINKCTEVGIQTKLLKLPEDETEMGLINYIKSMQNTYHGVIVQCPLPSHINEKNVMNVINPLKDVDGLTEANIGALHNGNPIIVPATASGVMELLDHNNINLTGMSVLLIGRSMLVNRPLQELMCQRDATVTLAHSKTKDLDKLLLSGNYDVVIAAIGKAKYLKNIKSKYILDVGINVEEDGKLCGDIDINTCKCDYFSKSPGGLGLLTVASVIHNVLKCYDLQTNKMW